MVDKFADGDNKRYMTKWSVEPDKVDVYNKYQTAGYDSFDNEDLGNRGIQYYESDFYDVV